jgi:hypothetical protein
MPLQDRRALARRTALVGLAALLVWPALARDEDKPAVTFGAGEPDVVQGSPEPLSGPVLHVRAGSPVAGADGSFAHPYPTIQLAVDRAPQGCTVLVTTGTYPGFRVSRPGVTVARATATDHVVVRESGRTNVVQFKDVVGGGIDGLDVVGSTLTGGAGVKVGGSQKVTVRNSRVHDGLTFGIVVDKSTDVLVERNEIWNNASGIEEWYASRLSVRANRVHHNLKPVNSGRGAEGMNFYRSTGPVLVEWNTLWNNRTHFEVYAASNLTFRYNTTRDGQVMETGTDGTLPCQRNTFTRNVSYRGSTSANGMILRCALDGLVANNVLDGFDQFAIDIKDGLKDVAYGGSIERLRVYNNALVGGRALSIDNSLPASVRVDFNLFHNAGSTAKYGTYLAYVAGHGNTKSLAELRAWTGYQLHGLVADPRFVARSTHDYRLQTTSPAIDRGISVGQSYLGLRPDIGRFERR